jgi:hypothetical protein
MDIREKKVDIKGFEPLTFSMQSRRSTTDLNAHIHHAEKCVIRCVGSAFASSRSSYK